VSLAIATSARVVIPGVPPAWTNERGHHMTRHVEMKRWKRDTWLLAHSARNAAHWPLPVRTDPPAPRYVRFDLYRVRLLDDDNAWASVKCLLDALAWAGEDLPPSMPGPLLVDDRRQWCRVLGVEQHQVPVAAAERVVITVHLVDPR